MSNKSNKTVFAKLTPDMTLEQIKRNLISALEKSGFTIKPSVAPTDKEGSA
jgi:hypothetical protein